MHYSIDSAESIRLPHFHNKPTASYFASLPLVHLFGLVKDVQSTPVRNIVMFTEDVSASKTYDEVLTIIDQLLIPKLVQAQATELHLTMDNTPRENKNFIVFSYLFSIVLQEYVPVIYVHFMVPGHTKNAVDAAFGLCKTALNNDDYFDPPSISEKLGTIANTTVYTLHNSYDWRSVVEANFNKVHKTKQMRHFRITNAGIQMRKNEREAWGIAIDNRKTQTIIALIPQRKPHVALPDGKKKGVKKLLKFVPQDKRKFYTQWCEK